MRGTATLIVLAILVSICGTRVDARSFKSPNFLPKHQVSTRDDIIARAKIWVEAHVPYDQRGRYQGYREDCSGFVSMAWGLEIYKPGLTTYTLPTASQQITKDDLQPGDILNNQNGGGNSDFAHVVIFESWVDSSHTHYNAYEENPFWGGTHYTVNIPYPFWPGFDTSEYIPMRLTTLANPATPTSSPTPSPTPTPTPSLTPTPSSTPTSSPTATPIPSTPVPVPTPTQPPTPTPPTPLLIMVQNVYTTDANQNVKTAFSPGDSIDYHVDAYNYQGTTVPVDVQFEVFAAATGNYSYNETIHVNMPAGLSRFYTPKQIPTNATSDEYIVRITITQSNDQRNTDWGEGRFTIG